MLAFLALFHASADAATDPCLPASPGELATILSRATIAGNPTTKYLSSGETGEIALRQKFEPDRRVRVFEVVKDGGNGWLRELTVLSVQTMPEKRVTGFTPADSTLVRVEIPSQPAFPLRNLFPLWGERRYGVLTCEGEKLIGASFIQAGVSNPSVIRTICVLAMIAIYMVFTYAVWKARNAKRPLERGAAPETDVLDGLKYPAYSDRPKVSFWKALDPVWLTATSLNQGSIQKLQVLLFSFLVGGMLLALVLRAGLLSDLSTTILGLLGISAVGAATTQFTVMTKERLDFDNWSWLVRKGALPLDQSLENTPRWGDLVTTNREFDIYKLQTLVFSLVVAIALLLSGESVLSTFEVPTTLLGILGLSQVVYLAGVLVRPPSIAELNTALKRLRELEINFQTVVSRNDDLDKDGNVPKELKPVPNPMPPLDERRKNAVNAEEVYRRHADQVQVMFETALDKPLDRGKLDPELK